MSSIIVNFNHPSEIYDLKNEKRSLIFDRSTSIEELYLEAYLNGLWVQVAENPFNQSLVMTIPDNLSAGIIAEQMVYCCKADKDTKPVYQGDINLYSLRTALYNCSKKLSIPISTGVFSNCLYCFASAASNRSMDDFLTGINVGDTRRIPLTHSDDINKLRTSVFNWANRKDIKVNTKVVGKSHMLVTRYEPGIMTGDDDKKAKLKAWLDQMPWDIPLPYPLNLDMTREHLRVTASRYKPGVFSMGENWIKKNTLMLCKYEHQMTLFIRGVPVEGFSVSRRSYLDENDIARINKLISGFGKTFEDLV